MSKPARFFAALVLLAVASAGTVHARGAGTHINEAKFYGPVYGWRYSPPPAAAPKPVCIWTTERVMRQGRVVTRRFRNCR
jgi:hypothetical protein